ncbi:MAG TPA: BTAD domain-containing putative transcriptional regulator [Gemmatimonadaceae bacterium]|nr:BTAD domain-containing putative transcriptional regulator [Gemmatimonadaceae bacterium]
MIRISALGGLSVRQEDGNPLSGAAAQPRRMAILAMLARAGQRGITREKVLSLLWPDADGERGPRTLAQALYALRKDLGAEAAISGSKELYLDPALVSSDVAEFAAAVARGDDERAVVLYHGPFLDGFHLPGADEFARWVERERAAIAAEHSRALESLARAARIAGNPSGAVAWWRKLAAIEPLNARVTVGLMDAMAAAGDRAGALQHARVYELLIEQELDLPPDKEVLAVAERLRQTSDEPARTLQPAAAVETISAVQTIAPVLTTFTPPEAAAPVVAEVVIAPIVSDAPHPATPVGFAHPARPRPHGHVVTVAALVVAVIAVAVALLRWRSPATTPGSDTAESIVAIGNIAAFGADSAQASLTAPVADLLTTSLARVHSIRVVSHGRMLELMRASGNASDTSGGRFVDAARKAGATELIDGTLYERPGGRLRLDLRRVDVASGAIGDVHTVEGSDLFALVDSGTARLVAALGGVAPPGSVADVTTRSLAAYRMYEQGIRAYYRGDGRTALGFFDAALGEDSLFALAAYYDALADPEPSSYRVRMERAKRLAARATDRERLVILAGWAYTVSSPAFRSIADTLVTRYPTEIEGHLYSGIARVFDGEFLDGRTELERVVEMDSLGLRGIRPRCNGCDALQWIVGAYMLADSMPAAEREAKRWVRLQPHSTTAAYALVNVFETEGRSAQADSAFQAMATADRTFTQTIEYRAIHSIRLGDYVSADRSLLAQLREPNPRQQIDALWDLSISLREQGKFADAYAMAHRMRVPTSKTGDSPGGEPFANVLEAQSLLEMGRAPAAAALFDSLARQRIPAEVPSQVGRNTAWMLAQSAGARLAAGDTVTLSRLADSVRALGEASGYGRDRRLHHYVRGLLLAARGDDAGAIGELTSAIYSLTVGFTRVNYVLARVYLHAHRPREAVAVLQPALRGGIDASNLYLNRTELHELLGQAWDAAGARDSAAAHYAYVAKTWSEADPVLQPRVAAARARLAVLKR